MWLWLSRASEGPRAAAAGRSCGQQLWGVGVRCLEVNKGLAKSGKVAS